MGYSRVWINFGPILAPPKSFGKKILGINIFSGGGGRPEHAPFSPKIVQLLNNIMHGEKKVNRYFHSYFGIFPVFVEAG